MAKASYEYGTLGSYFSICSRRPRLILEDLRDARKRRKQMFAAKKVLEKVADLKGEITSWDNQIRFEVKNSFELKRVLAAFGGIFNKEWQEYTGQFRFTRKDKFNDFWSITIDVERSQNCQVTVVEQEVKMIQKRYELVPGSCDPLTENQTIDA